MDITDKDLKEKHDQMYSKNEKDQNHNFGREEGMYKIRSDGNSKSETYNYEI